MGYLKRAGRALGGGLLAIVALSGCAEKVYDYSGEYEFLVGRDCTLLDSSTENTLEVAAASDSSTGRGYRVRLPIAATMELPAISAQASPNDAGELTVFFNAKKDGMMGYQSSQTMVMTLVPHLSKPDHLWLTRWTLSTQNNIGASNERDMLDLLLKSSRAQAESGLTDSIDLTNSHACLGKKNRLTLAERSALQEETVRQQEQLMADQVSRLRALSFEEFQAIDPDCNMTPVTPTCRAYVEQAGQRRAASRQRELERLSGFSDTALEAEGRSCRRSREPRCLAIAEIAGERRAVALSTERSRLVAMSYSAFANHERASCAESWSEECKMYRSLEDQKWQDEITRLLSVYDGEELVNLEWSACNSASPAYREDRHKCNKRREVIRIKRSHQAQYYEEHPDELRETYNACIDGLDNLTTARNSKESQDIRYTFRCSAALDGARKSGIRDVFKTRM